MNKSRLLGLAIALFTPFFMQPAQAEILCTIDLQWFSKMRY